jgi:peroxiredoxin
MKTYRTLILVGLLLCSSAAMAHDFIFTDTQGKLQRLVDYRGKWVVVNFWGTSCEPCQAETQDLIDLHNAHKNTDLVVIGVALDSSRASVAQFVAKHAIPYPIIFSSYTMVETEIGTVNSLPTSYLFDPTGNIAIFQESALTRADVEGYLFLKNKHPDSKETK